MVVGVSRPWQIPADARSDILWLSRWPTERSAGPTSVPSPGVPWTAMASSSFASTWYAPTARLLPAQAWAGGNPRPAMAPGLHAEPKDDIEESVLASMIPVNPSPGLD